MTTEAIDLGSAIEVLYGGYRFNGDRLHNEIKKAIKSDIFNASDVMTDEHRAVHAVCEWLGIMSIEELVAAVRSECAECGTPTCPGDCADMSDPAYNAHPQAMARLALDGALR